jgi:AAA+ superfamily predicted ATPase
MPATIAPAEGLFNRVTELPDTSVMRRYAALVGLDEMKTRMVKDAQVLLDPASIDRWNQKHHKGKLALAATVKSRPPLFLFGGDVGTGKTELAETFGDAVARACNLSVKVYSLSLTARGTGAVGEMTRLITEAFDRIRAEPRSSKTARILIIDEADALAQSRELSQMHHEDRAGVNALIRGIDDLARAEARTLVIMCTNRLDAIDPAVRRRAAATFEFNRPEKEQRQYLLERELQGADFSAKQLEELADLTGPSKTQLFGCTYSDITQRLLPTLLMDSFPDRPLDFARAKSLTASFKPTPPFKGESKP